LIREGIAQAGFMEVLTFALISRDENFKMMGLVDDDKTAVTLANAKAQEFQLVRTSLLPGLLKVLFSNLAYPLPIKIFELSDVAVLDSSRDVGSRNVRRLGALYTGTTSGFEVVHGLLDRLMALNDSRFVAADSAEAKNAETLAKEGKLKTRKQRDAEADQKRKAKGKEQAVDQEGESESAVVHSEKKGDEKKDDKKLSKSQKKKASAAKKESGKKEGAKKKKRQKQQRRKPRKKTRQRQRKTRRKKPLHLPLSLRLPLMTRQRNQTAKRKTRTKRRRKKREQRAKAKRKRRRMKRKKIVLRAYTGSVQPFIPRSSRVDARKFSGTGFAWAFLAFSTPRFWLISKFHTPLRAWKLTLNRSWNTPSHRYRGM